MADIAYPFHMRRLPTDDGGGYFIEFPDLAGCVSDGDTIDEAIANGCDALDAWLATAREFGDPIPRPGSATTYSGRWVQRVPKGLHARLAAKAREEGVSLNALATTLLALGLGEPVVHRGKARAGRSPRSRTA